MAVVHAAFIGEELRDLLLVHIVVERKNVINKLRCIRGNRERRVLKLEVKTAFVVIVFYIHREDKAGSAHQDIIINPG